MFDCNLTVIAMEPSENETLILEPVTDPNDEEGHLDVALVIFRVQQRPVLFVICLLLDLITAIGQGLGCLVYVSQGTGLSNPTTLIMFNQNFAQLVVVILHALNLLVPSPSHLPPTVASKIFCRVWLSRFILESAYEVTLLSLVLSCFDRYLATLHPVWHRARFSNRHARIGIAIFWIAAFVTTSHTVIMTSYEPVSGSCQTATSHQVLLLVLSVPSLFVPLFVVGYCYANIFRKLHSTAKDKGAVHGAVYRRAKTNLTVNMFVMFVAHVLLYSLFFVLIAIWDSDTDGSTNAQVLSGVVLILPILCVLINFFTSYYVNVRFRNALLKLLRTCFKRFKTRVGVTDEP